jgi:hypothetical protein
LTDRKPTKDRSYLELLSERDARVSHTRERYSPRGRLTGRGHVVTLRVIPGLASRLAK